MQILQAWTLNPDLNAFLISVRVINPTTKVSKIKNCLFDTGFSGFLGLDPETVEELGLETLGRGAAITVGGKLDFENFLGEVELVGENQQTLGKIENPEDFQESPYLPYGVPIQTFHLPILGMKSISQFNWMILAEQKWLCLFTETETESI